MDLKSLHKGFSLVSRPLTYTAKGGAAYSIRGVLARPSAEELVAGFEESQRTFTALYADLKEAGLTTFQKYDSVTDPDSTRVFNVSDVSIRYHGEEPVYVVAEVLG